MLHKYTMLFAALVFTTVSAYSQSQGSTVVFRKAGNSTSQFCVEMLPQFDAASGSFCGASVVIYTSLSTPTFNVNDITPSSGALSGVNWSLLGPADLSMFGTNVIAYQVRTEDIVGNINFQSSGSESDIPMFCIDISDCGSGDTYSLLDQDDHATTPNGSPDAQIFGIGFQMTARISSTTGINNSCGPATGQQFAGTTGSLTTTCSNVLPVELTNFDVQKLGDDQSLIFWQTVSELDNDYFAVERSADGLKFQEIGRVQGAGTTTETLNYEFVDKKPIQGNNYYRLRQVDLDGAFTYSEIKALYFSDVPKFGISIFPNPATNLINIRLGDDIEGDRVDVEMYNNVGQMVTSRRLSAESGGAIIQTSSYPSGVYIVVAKSNGKVTKETIVIAKD